jgi:hypothetical protein
LKQSKDKIIQSVIKKINQRSVVGIKKYNTTLYENNTDDFLIHLQQELMDGVNYIEKLIQQRNNKINGSTTTK